MRRLTLLALPIVLLASACGTRAFQDELAELHGLINANSTELMRVETEEIEDQNVRELREQAISMLDAAEVNYDYAAEAWGNRKDDQAEEFSRVGLIYYNAAENYSETADGRLRLAAANRAYQDQRERRNAYDDQIRSESELVALLETIGRLFERNEALRREMATMESQFQSESRSVYAIQEARILQREAEGMKAPEFATEQYTVANASLTRAVAHYDEGDYEAAYDVALRSMEEYRLSIETSQPSFLAEQDNLLRDGQNQEIFEEAQRRFGAELAFIDARGIVVVIPGLFARGSSNMVSERIYLLDEILTILRSFENRQILIEGHTQDRGSGENNMALSQTRSSEVQDHFLQRAISADRLSTAGFGEEAPRFDNRTDGGRADNDRVEIVFVVQ